MPKKKRVPKAKVNPNRCTFINCITKVSIGNHATTAATLALFNKYK